MLLALLVRRCHCSRENPAWFTFAASGNIAVCLNTDTDLLTRFFLSTHADRQGVGISFTVCNFVCLFLFVCTVTGFTGEDKASGVKFYTFIGALRMRISHFGELCSPRSLKPDAQRLDVGSAFVDNRQSLHWRYLSNFPIQ